jgi:hypothetical protein
MNGVGRAGSMAGRAQTPPASVPALLARTLHGIVNCNGAQSWESWNGRLDAREHACWPSPGHGLADLRGGTISAEIWHRRSWSRHGRRTRPRRFGVFPLRIWSEVGCLVEGTLHLPVVERLNGACKGPHARVLRGGKNFFHSSEWSSCSGRGGGDNTGGKRGQ